jgi:hypothetical protein
MVVDEGAQGISEEYRKFRGQGAPPEHRPQSGMRKAPIRAIAAKLILQPYPWSIVTSEQTLYNAAAATVVTIITLGFATAMAYRYHVASLAKTSTKDSTLV